MKISWGYKLTIAFILFGGFILYLVYRCVNTEFDLVSKEYYADELAFQSVIDANNRAVAFKEDISITQQDENIFLVMPVETNKAAIQGEIYFYSPSNATNDVKFNLKTGEDGIQQIPEHLVNPGKYVVKLTWYSGSNKHHLEYPFNKK